MNTVEKEQIEYTSNHTYKKSKAEFLPLCLVIPSDRWERMRTLGVILKWILEFRSFSFSDLATSIEQTPSHVTMQHDVRYAYLPSNRPTFAVPTDLSAATSLVLKYWQQVQSGAHSDH